MIIIQAIARSLSNKFPHVRVFESIKTGGYHFIASMQPIRNPDPEAALQKMPDSARHDYLEWFKSKTLRVITLHLATILEREIPMGEFLHEDEEILISDEHPFNEYYLLRRFMKKGQSVN